MLSPTHKLRRLSRSPREFPRAQLQNELPSRYIDKKIHHPHSEMHVKGTDKRACDHLSTLESIKGVCNISNFPSRAWWAASTLPSAPHSPRHGRSREATARPDQREISRQTSQS